MDHDGITHNLAPQPRRQLSQADIIEVGKRIGNQINGHEGFALIDPVVQAADHQQIVLEVERMLDPFEGPFVPEDVDDSR